MPREACLASQHRNRGLDCGAGGGKACFILGKRVSCSPEFRGSRFVYRVSNTLVSAELLAESCEGGYSPHAMTPVDQFLWSAHFELVAVFGR